MKHIVLLSICLAVVPLGAQAGKLYRWVDAQGRVEYGDTPPADATQVTPIKSSADVVPGEYLPYETRRAQQNFPVTLYVAKACSTPCDEARNLLNERGIPFSEKTIITQEELDAFKALTGFDSAPTLAVGKIFLQGFQAKQWHRELDGAGYPKAAPYRAPRPPAAASQTAPASPESPAESAAKAASAPEGAAPGNPAMR